MRRVFMVEVTDEELAGGITIRALAQEFMGDGRVYQVIKRSGPCSSLKTAYKPILMEEVAVSALVGILHGRDKGQGSKEERDGDQRSE